jgi:hypothetical protein
MRLGITSKYSQVEPNADTGCRMCSHLPATAHLAYVLGRRAPPESRCRSVSFRNEGQVLRGKTHCGLLAVCGAYVAGRADEAR